MGYKTRVSPPGADRGVDIFASPDGLGLEEPRIFVEVKHRLKSAMGAREPTTVKLPVCCPPVPSEARAWGDRARCVPEGGITPNPT
jgi:hypothetical protein